MLFCGLFFVRLIIAVQTQFLLAKTKKKKINMKICFRSNRAYFFCSATQPNMTSEKSICTTTTTTTLNDDGEHSFQIFVWKEYLVRCGDDDNIRSVHFCWLSHDKARWSLPYRQAYFTGEHICHPPHSFGSKNKHKWYSYCCRPLVWHSLVHRICTWDSQPRLYSVFFRWKSAYSIEQIIHFRMYYITWEIYRYL